MLRLPVTPSRTHALSEKKLPVIPEDRQSQLKLLIARGKEQGYLTYAEVNDHLPVSYTHLTLPTILRV